MIVLMVSLDECQSLIAGTPDQALRLYLRRSLAMEAVLRDDHLPNAVLLKGLELDDSKRNYEASVCLYATCTEADEAWQAMAEPASTNAVDPMDEIVAGGLRA